MLTGKYLPGAKPVRESRAGRNDKRILESEFRDESLRHAQRIKAHAEKRGMTAGQFALNWVLNNKLVTSVLAGPRTEPQWREYLGALDLSPDPLQDPRRAGDAWAAGHWCRPTDFPLRYTAGLVVSGCRSARRTGGR